MNNKGEPIIEAIIDSIIIIAGLYVALPQEIATYISTVIVKINIIVILIPVLIWWWNKD